MNGGILVERLSGVTPGWMRGGTVELSRPMIGAKSTYRLRMWSGDYP